MNRVRTDLEERKQKYDYFTLEIQNFEPLNPEIGVGFHLDKADSDIYLLPPRGTAIIPVSVTSSMWGTYTDLLQVNRLMSLVLLFFYVNIYIRLMELME